MQPVCIRLFKILAVCSLIACGNNHSNSTSQTNSIIDQDSTVEINPDTALPNEQLKEELGAIGKMSGGCTAFHLGHGIVATAGHCLQAPKMALSDTSCHTLDIVWGQTNLVQKAEHSRCLKILDYRYDQQADYALLQVDPVPAASVSLQPDARELKFNARAMVVGYPKGKTLSFSGTCELNWSHDTEDQFFHHGCDTLPGNSGSPVMDSETAQVIGIHNGDIDNNENYGTFFPSVELLHKFAKEAETPVSKPESLDFGPFGDLLNSHLVNFTSRQAPFVSFDLDYDIEEGYDKLLLIDGLGRSYELTGTQKTQYEHLSTPVSLVVITDYSGSSRSVKLSHIRYE